MVMVWRCWCGGDGAVVMRGEMVSADVGRTRGPSRDSRGAVSGKEYVKMRPCGSGRRS